MILQKKASCAVLTGVFVLFCLFGLLACAPQRAMQSSEAHDSSDSVSAALVEFTWSNDSDCAMCHDRESASFEDPAYGAFVHAADVACSTCHANAEGLSSAHEGATAEKAAQATLRATTVQEQSCESCHDLTELVQATTTSTVLIDDNGTVVNPHAISESESHSELSCLSCHQMHVADADREKKAQRACASCHHANLFECYTCHS